MFDLSKEKIFLNIAFSLLLGIFSVYMLSSLGFIFGLSINSGYVLIATILLIFVPLKCYKISIYESLLSLIFIFAAVVIFYYLSVHILDYSYDGLWYHQSGVLFLKKGWNPIYMPAEEFFQNHWNTHVDGLVWIDSYPKFYEIFAANIFYLTGDIEGGKILSFLSLTTLFFYAFHVLEKQVLKNKPLLCFFFCFLLICNPVVLAQIFTYYVDGLVYMYFMLLLLSLVDIQQSEGDNKTARFILIMSSVLLANLKLGGLCYAVLILILCACFRYFRKQNLRTFGKDCAIIALLVSLSGINPYFTNLYKGKHILHPVAGSEKIDIISHNMPTQFFDKSMPYKFFMSTFSKVDNSFSEYKPSDTKIKLKIPFSVYASEINLLKFWDVRQCGFGIFWSGILIIALILSFFIHIKDKQLRYQYYFIITLLLSSILLNPENWWARYVPQFYAVPIFVLIYYYITASSRRRFCVILFTSLLIFINSAVLFEEVYKEALYISSIRKVQNQNMEIMKNNKELVKHIEQNPIRQDFTAPALLFLDKAKGE